MVSQVLAGLVLGTGYALAAAGLALIFGVLRVVNFAQGEFYMFGALGVLVFTGPSLPPAAAVVVTVLAVGLLGALIFRVLIMPVAHDELSGLMITFGLSLVMVNGVLWWHGATPEPLTRLVTGSTQIAGDAVSNQLLIAGVISIIAIVTLGMFLRRTSAGLRIRASADNRTGADVSGVRFSRVQTATFAIGVGLAALAGALLGPQSFFTHDLGHAVLAKSFAIVVLGGMGSIFGAFWAALLLGVLESLAIGYLPGGWQEGTSYGLLVAVIVYAFFLHESKRPRARRRHLRRTSGGTPRATEAAIS